MDTGGEDGVAEIDQRLPSLRAARYVVRGLTATLPEGPLRDQLAPQVERLEHRVIAEEQGEQTLLATLPDGRSGSVVFVSWHRGTCDDEARRRASQGASMRGRA